MTEYQMNTLKNNKPVPISKDEKRKLMRLSGKTVFIMLVIMAASAVFGLVKKDLVVMLAIGGILCFVALMLEMKDKIKYCTYKQIEKIVVYIDETTFTTGGYKFRVVYYDFDKEDFAKTTVFIDRMDVVRYRINKGSIEKMMVGIKKSKFYYITSKSMYEPEEGM